MLIPLCSYTYEQSINNSRYINSYTQVYTHVNYKSAIFVILRDILRKVNHKNHKFNLSTSTGVSYPPIDYLAKWKLFVQKKDI